jgi:hypothetical protein
MHSTFPPTLAPAVAPSIVGTVPSPAMSPAIVGRSLYEQPAPFQNPSANADFEIERITSPRAQPRPPLRRAVSDYANEALLQSSIANVIAGKARPFAVSGRIPVDPATLTLFFRTKVIIGFPIGSDPPMADKRSPEWNHALP